MYIELDEGYPGHRKTLRLCALLKCDTADSYPPRLWAWATRSAPTGDLTGMEPAEIELALRYRGKPGTLFEVLVRAGFIDRSEDGTTRIHNWKERTGGAIDKMETRAYRVRERRAHYAGKCLDQCSICAEHVPGSDPDLSQAQINPDQTRPDQTRPDQTRTGDPRAHARSNRSAVWRSEDWRKAFGRHWCDKYQQLAYGHAGDSRACATLTDTLARLPRSDLLATQARADEMFAEFFANEDPFLVERRHPFFLFVGAWGGLRAPKKMTARRPTSAGDRTLENIRQVRDEESVA